MIQFTFRGHPVVIEVIIEIRDMWVGCYWQRKDLWQHLWIILPPFGFPCFPIHVYWHIVDQRMLPSLEYSVGIFNKFEQENPW